MCALVCLPKPIAVSYSEISQHLTLAAQNGDVDKIKRLIDSMADERPVPSIFNGYKLLCKAIEFSQPQVVEVLLNYIVNVENKAPLYTALHYAVLDNNAEITRLIAHRGANLNAQADIISDSNFDVQANRYATIFYRLSEKYSLISEESEEEIILRKYTPLQLAFRNNNLDLIETLIFNGADPIMANLEAHQLIDVLIRNNHTDIMNMMTKDITTNKYLLEKFENLECSNESFEYITREINAKILREAISSHDSELAIELIDSGVDVDAEDKKSRYTLLMNAVLNQNLTVIKHLLNKRVDINAWAYNDGLTAMHFLFMHPFYNDNLEDITLQVANLFTSRGVDLNIPDCRGMTPLHLVPYDLEKIKFLLEHNADINLLSIDENHTPFSQIVSDLRRLMENKNESIYDEQNIWNISKVFIKHIVKLLCKNLFVHPRNFAALEEIDYLIEFKDKCYQEAEDMRTFKCDEYVTLFDFWIAEDLNRLVSYVCNRKFIEFVTKSEKFIQRFPIYSADLKDKLNQCLTQKYLIDMSRNLIAKL